MAKKTFPEFNERISMTLTPMVLIALLVKKHHPKGKIVFIIPCVLKRFKLQEKELDQMLNLF
jgi:iron only hydrogenase large subunit-like protein